MSDKKKAKTDKKKLVVRIVCLFLAILMVGGVAYSIIASLSMNCEAQTGTDYVRCGLSYGSSAQSAFTLSSGTGFELGTVDDGYNFSAFLSIPETSIRLSCQSGDVSMPSSIAVQKTDKTLIYGNPSGYLYIRAKNPSNTNCIQYNSNKYTGIFRISRNGSSLCVVNVLPLEEYVKGVLPYEVYTSWPKEMLKAFSVVVRSYTLCSVNRHSSYDFDLCSTTHCQVYKGRNLVNNAVENAVNETAGKVIKYNGKTVAAYYSDSTGGCTVSANNTWGSSSAYNYLKAIPTPWERYSERSRGSWVTVYSPSELYTQLHNKGYFSAATGKVASVEITEFCENSSYVYSVLVKSVAGESVTISRADKVRSAFGLYSANFVCGKGGETVYRTEFKLNGSDVSKPLYILTKNGKFSNLEKAVTAITSSGVKSCEKGGSVRVLTAYGEYDYKSVSKNDVPANPTLKDYLNGSYSSVKTLVKLQGSNGSFVFDGRGWGHGVGFSQWGMYDLANLGASYSEIITAYLSNVTIGNY